MDQVALELFVSGETNSSRKARENLKALRDRFASCIGEVAVTDVLANPARAEAARVLATPTLVIRQAGRQKRIVGDLSDTAKVLDFLGLSAAPAPSDRESGERDG